MRKLRETDWMLAEGKTIPEVAKALEVSGNTFSSLGAQYGGRALEVRVPQRSP